MKRFSILLLVAISVNAMAQNTRENYFKQIRSGFSEKNAMETTAFVEKYFRVPGNEGFNASIRQVETILKKAGYKLQKDREDEAPLTYRIEKRPMKRNTWEPVDAVVKIEGEAEPLLSFATNRNMLPINTLSTPEGGITAEVVMLSANTKPTEETVKGKIAFSESMGATRLYNAAITAGAVAALGYSMPAYTKPEIHQTSIQFNSISPTAPAGGWAINLSYAAKERLKKALAKGVVKLHFEIKTKSYPAEELTIVANVIGALRPSHRFVYSAHVQEPGANDNATGVGTLAEMARLTAQMIRSGKIATPARTITFLWGDEIVSTQRYIEEDKVRAAGILWGMSLDMVGEDTKKTGGTFLLEKMPDPSAIWTRGKDKHSEWGGSPLTEKDMVPHYYNDFIFDICKEQGKYANWEVNFNPFEGGSDHTPFLRNKIPGLLMWHFTDVFYHTDNDRIDKVSSETMKNVGVSALTAGLLLASANENTAVATINELINAATERLKIEYDLGKENIAKGMPADKEQHIIQVWGKYYTDALATVATMPVTNETSKLGSSIKFGVNQIEKQVKGYLDLMK